MHIWTLKNWMGNINIYEKEHRTGLHLRCDKNVVPEVRIFCKAFVKWLRREFFFPVRVPVYIKGDYRIKAKDEEKVVGTFFRPYDYPAEPYIRIATGDYKELVEKYGEENAMWAILGTIAHELTHYFQYVNNIVLTEAGEERQATMYSTYILEEYDEYLNNGERKTYEKNIWKSNNWQKNKKIPACKCGIWFYMDKNIDENIYENCKNFLKYLKQNYFFPVRVNIFIKTKPFIRTNTENKKKHYFEYKENNSSITASIIVLLENYQKIMDNGNKSNNLIHVLTSISYELTHYFQWINDEQLTEIGAKRQASKYAKRIVDAYLYSRANL